MTSSYEILRHTFSILKEESPSAIIAVQKKNLDGGYSAFDIPVFERSPISVKRLGVEDLQKKSKYLLLFYPIRSIQLLIGAKKDYPEEMEELPLEMQEFCEERGITLHIMLR